MAMDYTIFDQPYNNNLERTDTIPSTGLSSTYGDDIIQNPGNVGEEVLGGKAFDNLVITSWIKSDNYRPKTHGFIIDGRLGYIECMQLYVGSGGIIGGSLDIPDYTSTNSFHVDASGNMWLGINTSGPITSAPAYILNTGDATFNSIMINGLSGNILAAAIDNTTGDLLTEVRNSKLDTSTEEILGDYTFGASGSIYMATDANNGLWISPTGILGKKAGVPTFTITTSGDATFAGELNAAYGTFGTITAGVIRGSTILGNGSTTAVTVGGSINTAGNFINDLINSKINTSTRDILLDFDFGGTNYAGAVKAGSVTWDTSTGAYISGSGVVVYRNGIAGFGNLTGGGTGPTFSISATTGAAYFQGAIGSATSISAPVITGGTINGSIFRVYSGSVPVGSVTAGSINLYGANLYIRKSVADGEAITGYLYGRVYAGRDQVHLIASRTTVTGGDPVDLFIDASSGQVRFNAMYFLPVDSGDQFLGKYSGGDSFGWAGIYLGTPATTTPKLLNNVAGVLTWGGVPVGTGGGIPAGGSANQILVYLSPGTAQWSSNISPTTLLIASGSSGRLRLPVGTNLYS